MLENAFIIAFSVFAIHATMWHDMVFGDIQDLYFNWAVKIGWSEEKAVFWSKPLFSCPICCTPYYGTVIYLLFFPWDWALWAKTILIAMGINTVFVKLSKED